MALRDERQSVLQIKVSDKTTLNTDRFVFSAFASCVRDLPGDATVWDVSGLLLEGQQVKREVVVAWLDLSYQSITGEPFESKGDPMEHFPDGDPEVAESMSGLVQLLAFADAVGSSKGLLLALEREIAAAPPALFADFGYEYLRLGPSSKFMLGLDAMGQHELLATWSDEQYAIASGTKEQMDDILHQVTDQLEALLFLAYKLQLEQIQQVVVNFIRCNSFCARSMLWDKTVLDRILSKRVLATPAAADASTQALQDSLTTQILQLAPHPGRYTQFSGTQHLLRPVDLSEQKQKPISFTAEVQRDFMTYRKGQQVEVAVDLFKSSVLSIKEDQAASVQLPLRLLLGEPHC